MNLYYIKATKLVWVEDPKVATWVISQRVG